MALFDDIGNVITDTNISSPPVVNVLFSRQVLGEVPPDSMVGALLEFACAFHPTKMPETFPDETFS